MEDFLKELAEEAKVSPEMAPVGALEGAQLLGAELKETVRKIEEVTAALNRLKIRKYEIETKDLVELMDQAKIEDFSYDGTTFIAGPYCKASIPEEHRDEAHRWLEEHEAGDLINRTIVISLPKDSEEEAAAIQRWVRERYQQAEIEEKKLVPWARLTSWLKDLYQNRKVDTVIPPLEIMGATIGRVVKIKEKRKD